MRQGRKGRRGCSSTPPGVSVWEVTERVVPLAVAKKERDSGVVTLTGQPTGPVALTDSQLQAAAAAGLLYADSDGHKRVIGIEKGELIQWVIGVLDQDGRPLPFLRDGVAVVPKGAAAQWDWRQGGMSQQEVTEYLHNKCSDKDNQE